ncbi:MAG: class I SAM-dependent methyltransferase [Muribaculaceae bacterium]|nr:class I SAM-dependent methyltransferase [Muribaculaceae bacterium]
MTKENDPMGRAIAEYQTTGRAERLRVFSPMFDEDEIPVATLFRDVDQMPAIEREALRLTRGATLDVGAGAGCHSLPLQARGIDVTAIDLSPLAVETMRQRGVRRATEQDFYDTRGKYDTILMLMNGIGIVGTLAEMPRFFSQLDRILAPGGQVLCDSSDICYVFENEDGIIELPPGEGYYGELEYRMQYRDTIGEPFAWLYIDPDTLAEQALRHGFRAEVIARGDHYDYLALIQKSK